MTADIETLPLPEPLASKLKIMRFRGEIATAEWWEGYLHRHARAVAEHNVARATAELHRQFGCELRDPNGTIWDHAAKLQAENEALRAEVAAWSKSYDRAVDLGQQHRDRAERMAEVLAADRDRWEAQKAGAIRDQAGGMTRGDPEAVARCDAAIQRINDALRDHDQEGSDEHV